MCIRDSIWLWDLITNYTPFERYHKYDKLTYILYAMPFLYPLLSWARGMDCLLYTSEKAAAEAPAAAATEAPAAEAAAE